MRGPSSLYDFTNVHAEDVNVPAPTSSINSTFLQRTKSYRSLQPRTDSCESSSSDHSSIYRAEVASPAAESEDEHYVGGDWNSNLPVSLADQLNGEIEFSTNIPEQPQPSPTNPHSKWPPQSLETITEQRSTGTLRPSLSPSRMNAIDVECTSPRPSITTGTRPSEHALSVGSTRDPTRRRKSFSLDDLDCRKALHSSKVGKNISPRLPAGTDSRRQWLSSSSSSSSSPSSSSPGYGHDYLCLSGNPTTPIKPSHPPLFRRKTPPGVPSFGSLRALRYVAGLAPGNEHSRHARNVRSDYEYNPTQIQSLDYTAPSGSPRGGTKLGRFLGLVPPKSAVSTSQPRTARVPAGIVARADDGTLLRGRFASRAGAHAATRELQQHPFHQLAIDGRKSETGADQCSSRHEASQQSGLGTPDVTIAGEAQYRDATTTSIEAGVSTTISTNTNIGQLEQRVVDAVRGQDELRQQQEESSQVHLGRHAEDSARPGILGSLYINLHECCCPVRSNEREDEEATFAATRLGIAYDSVYRREATMMGGSCERRYY